MRKVTGSVLLTLILLLSVLSVFLNINYSHSIDSEDLSAPPQKASTNFQDVRVSEHNDSIWAGRYFGFLGQAMQVQGNASLVATGDLNQDNYPDIAVVSQPNGPISLFFWNASEQNFSFENPTILQQFSNPRFFAIADINNDSKNDLIVVWYDPLGPNINVSFLLQTSPGTFLGSGSFATRIMPDEPMALLVGQFDSEMGNDVAVICRDSSKSGTIALLFYAPSLGRFNPQISYINFVGAGITVACSIENMTVGQPSEIVVGFASGNIKIFKPPLNVGSPYSYLRSVSGSIVTLKSGNLTTESPTQWPDFLAVTKNPNNTHIFYRQSDAYPVTPIPLDLSFLPLDAAIGDLNSDGLEDIALTSDNPRSITKLYFQQNSGTRWGEEGTHTLSVVKNPTSIAIADFDNNNYMDICEASNANASTSLVAVYYGIHNRSISACDLSLFLPNTDTPGNFVMGEFTSAETQLLTLDPASGLAKLYNNNDGSLSIERIYQTGPLPIEIESGNLNNDSYDDFVIIDNNGTLSAYFGAESMNITISGIPTGVVLSDLNNDGLDDVVVSTENNGLHIFINTGTSIPLPSNPTWIIGTTATQYVSPEVDQLDSDNLPDIVVGNIADSQIEIFNQTSSMAFSNNSKKILWIDGNSPNIVATGDFDSDGDIDIASVDQIRSKLMRHNQSNGSFSLLGTQDTIAPVIALIADDLSDDNKTDILAIMPNASLAALYIQGDEGIESEPQETLLLSANTTAVIAFDYNDNLRNDILTLSSDSKAISIWTQLNHVPVVNIFFEFSQREGIPLVISIDVQDGTSQEGSHNITWDFGDGNFNTTQGVYSISHTYQSNDCYTITVNVTDPERLSASVTSIANITDSEPSVDISVTPSNPYQGQIVTIEAVEDVNNWDPIVNYTWKIDGESINYRSDFTYRFSLGGNHSIELNVTDSDGSQNSSNLYNVTVYEIIFESDPAFGILEFDSIELNVDVQSPIAINSYEWDLVFNGTFSADETTSLSNYSLQSDHFDSPGNYSFAVRVYDNMGDWGEVNITIEVWNRVISGSFESNVHFERNQSDTSMIHFDATGLNITFPDIYPIICWDWDDGTFTNGTLLTTHDFMDDRDYLVQLILQDDEENQTILQTTLHMKAPTISLEDYSGTIYARNNTTLNFVISDDSEFISETGWSINDGAVNNFTSNYSISLEEWGEGQSALSVFAEDSDSNLAFANFTVVIDNTPPSINITYQKSRAYVGDDINITVIITDPNISPDEVYLHYSISDLEMPAIQMQSGGEGVFWAIIPGPPSVGTISFYVTAEDLAGNIGSIEEPITIQIVNHLLTQIWPFASIGAILAAIGLFALMRIEAMTAIDETFVIYDDGRLISHQTRRLKPDMDHDILSGMFVAVQEFVKDSFKDETLFDLRRLEFGDKSILVERGEKIFLAVVIQGRQSRRLVRRMKKATAEIETKYATVLTDWDGDIDSMRGVQEITRRLYTRKLFGADGKWLRRAT